MNTKTFTAIALYLLLFFGFIFLYARFGVKHINFLTWVVGLLLLWSAFTFGKTFYFYLNSETTIGYIDNYTLADMPHPGGMPASYYPKIKFQDKLGNAFEFLSYSVTVGGAVYRNNFSDNLGAQIPVRYYRYDPKNAWQDNSIGLWGLPFIILIIAAMAGIGLFIKDLAI